MAKLLLVDDDPNQRGVMRAAIDAAVRVEIIVKTDGDQALEFLNEFVFGTQGAPAVVFLDLAMPTVSGFEVLRQLKQHATTCQIPIVVFTASQREADVYLGYHLGANAYVVKPADPAEFRRTVAATASFWLNTNVRPPHC